jgi:thioredoxin
MKKTLLYMVSLAAAALMAMTAVNAQMKDFTIRTLSTKEFCEKVYDINADELKYKGEKPAIVDFYADWCGPCRAIAPVLQELADKYGDEIVIYKVNIDNSPELAQAFGIMSIPAVMYIPLKGEPAMTLGARDKAKFEKEIAAYLKK